MRLSAFLHPNPVPCGVAARAEDEVLRDMAAKLPPAGGRRARVLRDRRRIPGRAAGEILQKISGSR